ncbi:GNAT family N-acetyltransferase [Kosakonia pseudosacchari]|uniref:GNAT family N-acetyltransferase n=1 Tax=Kosakonia pseudosacchari TaxID=1646340 RepID=A0ABX4IL01_9ENTR|nr:GNAT family N-acetyltransferase [Kosakonia pseudosacchari]PDO84267.1 GNAT family N-acetyltransferase [Kosakonia pseudosacchari]QOV63251.1 GNAT family N-acetyltransferase [Kosakonia pseudosacchari]WBU50214.1 GNAT family N-acetyltransferase [Kosakonia pseudosacchari]
MKIIPLYDAPHFADQVVDWLWREFGDSLPRDFFASIIAHSQRPGQLPLTFVLVDEDQLLGTVGLWRCDLISRQDLFPWLAALYVKESARGQGLAGQLQRHVIEQAKAMGFQELHLYSACRDFYERFGWRYIGDGLDYPDKTVHLYRYSCGAITE